MRAGHGAARVFEFARYTRTAIRAVGTRIPKVAQKGKRTRKGRRKRTRKRKRKRTRKRKRKNAI